MTYGLLKAATVLVGDGQWTNTYEVDALSCGRSIRGADICSPAEPPENGRAGTGFKVVPFAVVGEQELGVRCGPAEALSAMNDAMANASEYVVAKQFWDGDIDDWAGVDEGMFLEHADVETVTAGTSVGASIAAAVAKAYENHPEIQPIVHLGIGAAMGLADNFFTKESNLEFVVSPGYPASGIAVTGQVLVHLGSVETVEMVDQKINKRYLSGTRLAAVEFDPCLAVRVA